MQKISALILATLVSSPLFAQSLPDEINYAPYQDRFESLSRQRDAAAAKLQGTQSDLAETRRFIREMREHIRGLEQRIEESSGTIADNRARLPGLERDLRDLEGQQSRLVQEIRSRESELSRLTSSYENEARRLRPMEDSYERKFRRVKELEDDVRELSGRTKTLHAQLDRSEAEYRDMDRQIRGEEQNRRRLEAELNDAQGAMKGVEGKISHLESQQRPIEAEIRSEKSKLQRLIGEVSSARSELQQARNSGADAATISRLENNLRSIVAERSGVEGNIRNLESRNSQLESQIRSEKSELAKLQNNVRRLPSEIRESESRERSLVSRKSSLASAIPRMRSELSGLEGTLRSREFQLRSEAADLRRDEQDLLRQRRTVEELAGLVKDRSGILQGLRNENARLENDIASTAQEIQVRKREIPALEQSIRADRNEISQGQREVSEALSDESVLMARANTEQAELNRLTDSRNSAQVEMNQRRTLFERYLNEAQGLGSAQASGARSAGTAEGRKILLREAKLNGEALGKSLGEAEARQRGLVRGEIDGYDSGYSAGRASREEIQRAEREGTVSGSSAAQSFVQTNLKPGYFEEALQLEFKKDLGVLAPLFSALRSFHSSAELELKEVSGNRVPPLSPAELSRSTEIVSPLDAAILSAAEGVRNIETQVQRMTNPESAFKAPPAINSGSANCSQVYKRIKAYVEACEASYKQSYERLFLAAAREEFSAGYADEFRRLLAEKQESSREASFGKEFDAAARIAFGTGESIGQAEIYQETYEASYRASYATELPLAKTRARKEADSELVDLLGKKPLLTLSESSLRVAELKALDEVPVKLVVKNISQVPLNAPVSVRITELRNASILTGSVSLNAAKARSLTELPDLKVKVLESARSGEELLIRGEILLPGDQYKPQRREEFTIRKLIAANPLAETQLRYDATPTIKGIFKRYVHRFTVSIAPKMEDLPQGYTLTLTPTRAAAEHMDMKTAEVKTAPLRKGSPVDADFSYVFKDSAKRQRIELDLKIEYAGKVLQQERITLEPK